MYEIIGFQEMQFTDRESGELVSGVMLHLRSDDPISSRRNLRAGGHCVISKFFVLDKVQNNSALTVGGYVEFIVSITQKGEPKITGCKVI